MKYYSVKTYTKKDNGLHRLLYCSFVRSNNNKEALKLHQKEFETSLNCDESNIYNVIREVSKNKRFSFGYKYLNLKDIKVKESGVLISNN